MITIDELHQFYSKHDYIVYETLVETIGDEIITVSDHDYQGDTICLLSRPNLNRFIAPKNPLEYAILVFGWGSCSGCDALDGCNSWEDVKELRDNLADGLIWYETRAAALEKDLESTYLSRELIQEFREATWRLAPDRVSPAQAQEQATFTESINQLLFITDIKEEVAAQIWERLAEQMKLLDVRLGPISPAN